MRPTFIMSFSVPVISSPGTSDTKTSDKPKKKKPPSLKQIRKTLKENPGLSDRIINSILREKMGKHCLLYLYDLHLEDPALVTIDAINDSSYQDWVYQEVKDDYYLRMMKWDLSGWDE